MVDSQKGELAIIDIDGGAPAKNGETPMVLGKLEPGWLAPEIFAQLKGGRQAKVTVKLSADLYAVAAGVHHLVFGLAPYFFIPCAAEIPQYLASVGWPKLRAAPGRLLANQNAFQYYAAEYALMPALHKLFTMAFQEGYGNPSRRPTAYEWVQALKRTLSAIVPAPKRVRPAPQPPAPAPGPKPNPKGLRPWVPSATRLVPPPGPGSVVPAASSSWIRRATAPMAVLALALLGLALPGTGGLAMAVVAALLFGHRFLKDRSRQSAARAAGAFGGSVVFFAMCHVLLGRYAGFVDGLCLGLMLQPWLQDWIRGNGPLGPGRRLALVWAVLVIFCVCGLLGARHRPYGRPENAVEPGTQARPSAFSAAARTGTVQAIQPPLAPSQPLPTPSPSPQMRAAAPLEPGEIVNLRAAPDFHSAIVATAKAEPGTSVEIAEEQGSWRKLRVGNESGMIEGWTYVPGRLPLP